MASDKTITINGRQYDAVTGLPIETSAAKSTEAPAPVSKPTTKPVTAPKPVVKQASKPTTKPFAARQPASPRATQGANAVHGTTTQRAATLSRRVAKKPTAPAKPLVRKPGRLMDVAPQSRNISHFAPHPVVESKPASKTPAKAAAKPVAKTNSRRVVSDVAARVHPSAQRALAKKVAAPAKPKSATAKQIKDAQIEKALKPTKKPAKRIRAKKAKKSSWLSQRSRRLLIIAGFILLAGLIVYGVYRLVPSISVGIAASQAGVNATYPEFTPDGYSLKQPIQYTDGKVDLTFQSNSNANHYTITQTRSTWDSSAVLDSVVKPKVGEDYVTTKERGLTIYTYGNTSSWVNGGVLYTIASSSTLSGDQIRRIATSM